MQARSARVNARDEGIAGIHTWAVGTPVQMVVAPRGTARMRSFGAPPGGSRRTGWSPRGAMRDNGRVGSDLELLARWRDGSADAGDELLRRHFASIYLFFNSKVHDHAQDLAQRTFLSCVEARDRLDDRASFKAYLFSVARRRLMDHFRRYHRRDAKTELGELSIADLAGTPSQELALREQHALLLTALRRLPLDFQICLELFYWEDMGIAEIADALEIAEGTVKSRLSRAKARLREVILSLDAPQTLRTETVTNLDSWARKLRNVLAEDSG